VREKFRSRIEARGASDLRINEDEEGRATVMFRLDAETEREATENGSEITLSALEGQGTRWVAGGVTHWLDEKQRRFCAARWAGGAICPL
jgi:hypothetical protein